MGWCGGKGDVGDEPAIAMEGYRWSLMAVFNGRRSIRVLAVAVMARKSPRQQCLQCSG